MITDKDISEVLTKETKEKSVKKRESKQKQEEQNQNPKEPIINFNEPNPDEDNSHIDNSDVLLSIIEIATNGKLYDINLSNKSRHYWDTLNESKKFSKVLSHYKSETLRKYWRIISEISSIDKVLNVVNSYKDQINSSSLKILTIITGINSFLKGNILNFLGFLSGNDKTSLGFKTSLKEKENEDESFKVDKEKRMLKSKRGKNAFDEMNLTLIQAATAAEKGKSDEIDENQKEISQSRRSLRVRNTSHEVFTANDKRLFEQIEEIVETFKKEIPECQEEEIWEALKRNSFNVISTYQYLVDPEGNEGKFISL